MESIEELIYKLGDNNRRVRRNAEKELVKIGKPAVGPLIHTLEDENWRAANALGKNWKATEEEMIWRIEKERPSGR